MATLFISQNPEKGRSGDTQLTFQVLCNHTTDTWAPLYMVTVRDTHTGYAPLTPHPGTLTLHTHLTPSNHAWFNLPRTVLLDPALAVPPPHVSPPGLQLPAGLALLEGSRVAPSMNCIPGPRPVRVARRILGVVVPAGCAAHSGSCCSGMRTRWRAPPSGAYASAPGSVPSPPQ